MRVSTFLCEQKVKHPISLITLIAHVFSAFAVIFIPLCLSLLDGWHALQSANTGYQHISAVSFSGGKSQLLTPRYESMSFSGLFINLWFWNCYRWIGSCKNSIERFPCTRHLVSLWLWHDSLRCLCPLGQDPPGTHLSWTSPIYYTSPQGRTWGIMGHLSQSLVERTCNRMWGFGWVIWGKSKEAGFTLDWLLSESRDNSMTGYLRSYL